MPLRPGETFGRYHLSELLGQGGMGEVYSAYDTVLHRKVALKVLTAPASPIVDATPTTRAARILREARAAAGIAHPNAVPIYDVGEVDGVPFLAMELVAGRTLRTFIGDESVLLEKRIRWLCDIARALAAAHQLGLVHRDIKPENVMVRSDGIVKVLDFGIARRAVDEGKSAPPPDPADLAALAKIAVTSGTLTADGVVVGTPMYMAPEQILGGALDGRTDQFAWGVLAYEVLTGRVPWDGTGVELVSQILSREVGAPSEMCPEVPAAVDTVVRRALRKVRDERFPGMEEIADALEPFAIATAAQSRQISLLPSRDAAFAATEELVVPTPGRTPSGVPVPASERKGRGRSWGVLAGVALVFALGSWGVQALSSARSASRAVPDAQPSNVPSQMSSNPDANTAYRAGLQALRDGSLGAALRNLSRAKELDPLFGAPQLRLALAKLLGNDASTITGADLQGAQTAQSSLGTHDRILLDAFELVARVPPDFAGGERLLAAAVEKYPSDADFPFQLALILDYASKPAEAANALELSIARDPTFAMAWRQKGDVRAELGDASSAIEAMEQCTKISPSATTCWFDLGVIQSNVGKCDGLVATARKLIALAPSRPEPYQKLAEGLHGSGEPVKATEDALQLFFDHGPAADRAASKAEAEVSLAVFAGDFPEAERQSKELERATASDSDDATRFRVAYPRALLDLELGRPAEALRRAKAYLGQHAGLPENGEAPLRMQSILLAGAGITRARFDELRDQWTARNQNLGPWTRWVEAYAVPAETRVDAEAALAAKPAGRLPANVLFSLPHVAEPIGRVYELAGRPDEAVPYLAAASASCAVLESREAIFSTWAALDLGAALEQRGDTQKACAAYQRVLVRWGAAGSRSRTANQARARRLELGCTL